MEKTRDERMLLQKNGKKDKTSCCFFGTGKVRLYGIGLKTENSQTMKKIRKL